MNTQAIPQRLQEWIHWRRRRLRLWVNRLRLGWEVHRRGWLIQITVPNRHRRIVRGLKYILTAIGLIIGFLIFPSPWHAGGLGILIYVITAILERTIFSYAALFIHALPTFDVDPDKWVGVGFGFARPPDSDSSQDIPMVGMMVTDVEYAKRLQELFLIWTGGERDDRTGNLRISIVVLSPTEYAFMVYPSPDRPATRQVFEEARRELRQTSLEDVLHEHHDMVVFGKRCVIGPGSYFPEFRQRWDSGDIPVHFTFLYPPNWEWADDPQPIVVHAFSIKDRRALTRRDWEHIAVGAFEVGGEWQGPPEQAPR